MAAQFTPEELTRATGGVWWCEHAPEQALELYTDSREDGCGRLFIALAGERFDAHDFLDGAIAHRAGALMIDALKANRIEAGIPVPVLVVPDTLRAYQALAHYHRMRFPALAVAAVTGSVGKTSVKEILRSIFTAAALPGEVLFTQGNTNNQIGVAQNLLRLTAKHRYAVIEMGTNHHGEIAPLSAMARPQAALVNTVAPCHLEHLGDRNGVAREKSRIYSGLCAGGIAVYPQDCPERDILIAGIPAGVKRLSFGKAGSGAAVEAEYRDGSLTGSRFRLLFPEEDNELEIAWNLTGAHQSLNAAAAAALARSLGIGFAAIRFGLEQCTLPGMRMRITETADAVWVNDAYNANPESMTALLRQLAECSFPQGLMVVLGDMLELGIREPELHREIVRLARQLLPEAQLIFVGPRFVSAVGEVGGECCADATQAAGRVQALAKNHITVVLKGSRGMQLEMVMPEELRDAQH